MAANTAVAFVLDGLALITIAGGRAKAAVVGAAWSLLAGGLTLAEYGPSVDFGFDQMLVADRMTTQFAHPGRLARTRPSVSFYAAWRYGMRHGRGPQTTRRPSLARWVRSFCRSGRPRFWATWQVIQRMRGVCGRRWRQTSASRLLR